MSLWFMVIVNYNGPCKAVCLEGHLLVFAEDEEAGSYCLWCSVARAEFRWETRRRYNPGFIHVCMCVSVPEVHLCVYIYADSCSPVLYSSVADVTLWESGQVIDHHVSLSLSLSFVLHDNHSCTAPLHPSAPLTPQPSAWISAFNWPGDPSVYSARQWACFCVTWIWSVLCGVFFFFVLVHVRCIWAS